MKLILASSSPRRAEILREAGIAFEIRATHINETAFAGETAHAMAARLAEAKARAAAAQINADPHECIIVGADTTVELDGEILGKPRDSASAREMLAKLSGRTHHVLTGIFVLRLPDNATRAAVENSAVTFAPLDEKEIKQDIYHSSSAGGQNVQKNETAVRLTHLPTGVVVSCQNERSQLKNREFAMKVLQSRLAEMRRKEAEAKMSELRGEHRAIEWGSQIRSYVLQVVPESNDS